MLWFLVYRVAARLLRLLAGKSSHAVLEVRYSEVHVVFADSCRFAEEWTYRFLSSALADSE